MSDEVRYLGIVCWFSPIKGYGFVSWEKDGVKQKDTFLHFSDLQCEGFKTAYKDQRVSFAIGKNHNGDPKAIKVEILKN
jgi:CspA family cold shock protein